MTQTANSHVNIIYLEKTCFEERTNFKKLSYVQKTMWMALGFVEKLFLYLKLVQWDHYLSVE